MIYADEEDIKRCKKIIRRMLKKNDVNINDSSLEKITKDVMNISYSKGGDYSDKIIQEFARVFIERELYKEYLD